MRLASRLMTLASLLALSFALPARATAPAAVPAGVSPFKYQQMRMLAAEPMRERREQAEQRERMRELRRLARKLHASGRSTLHVRGDRARPEVVDEDLRLGGRPSRSERIATPQSARALAANLPNVRCNDPSGDLLTPGFGNAVVEGQCETAIARWNNYLVAAWNDGKGFDDGTGQTLGWATSVDGGVTWIDHDTFPIPAAYTNTWQWTSDPVLAVNPTTGAFYFSSLASPSISTSTVGVVQGRFTGSSFAWGTPSTSRIVNTNSDYLDKEWISVDPTDGRVHLSYTDFRLGVSEIDYQFADSALAAWSGFRKLSLGSENGWVQGSRPLVGTGNSVYVFYYLIGPVDADFYRVVRSTDRGNTFGGPTTAVTFYANYGSGAPGFNRYNGVQFPSVAVDRSGGAHNGRLFLAWNESLNWYDDAATAGSGTSKNEVEPNETAGSATPVTLGQVLRGTLSGPSDFDFYALPLTAGQGILVICDSLSSGIAGPGLTSDFITMRMLGPDGVTRLCYTALGSSDIPAPWVFTAPATGTYYLRMASNHASAATYRLLTGPATRTAERGRDQRDVFTAYSDNGGVTWSTPTRVGASPAGYDDWLPEVAVAPDGQVACAWYDWRDATASTGGGESSIYLATSEDGGTTWDERGAVSDVRTPWTSVQTNIVPNEGDYMSLFASQEGLALAWSDGRGGNPDTYMEWIASDRPVSTRAEGVPGRVELQWFMDRTPGATAGLYRQVGGSATWDSIATLTLDATRHFAYTDTVGIVLGQTYRYQLGVVTSGTERFYPYVSVLVGNPALALAGAWPNPAHQDALITFTLRTDAPATLSLHDLNGRRVFSRTVSGMGRQQVRLVEGKRIEPGVYFLHLEQSGKKVSRRIVVV